MLLPDPTNLGPEGFAAFFSTHKCNQICNQMNLKSLETIDVTNQAISTASTCVTTYRAGEHSEELNILK